jgi:CheY-like chemotaxis protein/Tfp pilus assembly protein PilZ
MMKKILLVDDVRLLLDIQKRFLASSQVQILTAGDGEEALEAARQERPDLIIMDKYMPKMNGLDCCIAIKADPFISHIPVVMSTNAARQADAEEYMRAGCADILSKPIEGKTFLNTIRKYIPEIDRRGVRLPHAMEIKIASCNGIHDASSENLSHNGLFAVSDMNVSINDELSFSFMLPGCNTPMRVRGRVVWLRKGDAPPGFGVEFMEVTGEGMPMLRTGELKQFIKSMSQE